MKPSELTSTLTACMKAGLPVLIKGAPGVGKSDIVAQVANHLDMDTILSHPVVSDPTDPKGMPIVVNNWWRNMLEIIQHITSFADKKKQVNLKDVLKYAQKPVDDILSTNGTVRAAFSPFGDLHKACTTDKPTIWFLDDLGQAPPVVQAAYMQLLLARCCGENHVSDKVVFVAATNRRQDRAGVTGILEPVKSRFATILELTPDQGEWAEWAYANDMPGQLIAFSHFRPGLLTSFKPASDIINSPCPRTFANAGYLINAGIDSVEALSGAVGEGCAIEMRGFFKYWEQLPNLDAVIADPDNADIPTEPAALYAVVTGLVEKVTKSNARRILKYGNRLPKDFCILLGRDCLRKDKSIQRTKAFTNWVASNKDVFLAA